jgi:ribosomal protein L35
MRTTELSPTKICSHCKLEKSRETDFHKKALSSDGLRSACKACCNSAHRIYKKTPSGRASDKRYNQSEKGRVLKLAQVKRYQKTEKGRSAIKRYQKTAKGLSARKRYDQTNHGMAVKKAADKRYMQTENGRMIRRIAELDRAIQRRVDKA